MADEDPKIVQIRDLFAKAASFSKPRADAPKDSKGNPLHCDTEKPGEALVAWMTALVAITALPAPLRVDPWVCETEGNVLYGIACMYALLGDKKNALVALFCAVELSASMRELLEGDADMVSLRSEPEFATLLARAKEREAP